LKLKPMSMLRSLSPRTLSREGTFRLLLLPLTENPNLGLQESPSSWGGEGGGGNFISVNATLRCRKSYLFLKSPHVSSIHIYMCMIQFRATERERREREVK
jgi:hypothetical protein